jgi:hypothetical protein
MDESLMLQDFDSYTDISHSTTGLRSCYFLCDLFNIEYVHFIKVKGIEKVAKVGMPLLILLELYWR